MRRPFLRLQVHFVWSTWDREPLIGPDLLPVLHGALAEKARALGCEPVHVGGVADHVHVLVGIPATLAIAELVGQLKGASSHLANHRLLPGGQFRWQNAYGAFTVSPSDYAKVRDYVNGQAAHHRTGELSADLEIDAEP